MSIILQDEVLRELLTKQVAHELGNHILYKNLMSLCKDMGYQNSQVWFENQAKEEMTHYEMIMEFMNDVAYASYIEVDKLEDQSVKELKDLKDIFAAALKREEETTVNINKIAARAQEVQDYVTFKFVTDLLYIQRSEIDEATDRLIAMDYSTDDLVRDTYIGEMND